MTIILSDRYQIERQLGEGGFSSVYQAVDTRLDRKVAVKILKREVAEADGMVERFMREAKLTASLSHPHSLRIFDYGQSEEELYIISELLTGVTLDTHLAIHGPVSEHWLIKKIIPLCFALEEAHLAGVIHRDLKPSNLFLQRVGSEERLVLIDFGISKGEGLQIEKVTKTGQLFGTPHYMSPEQIQSPHQVKAMSDLYSLGVIIFELLAGEVPFNGDNMFELLSCHINKPPPLLIQRAPQVSMEMSDLVNKLLSKQPHNRPQSVGELIIALQSIEQDIETLVRPTSNTSILSSPTPSPQDTFEHVITQEPATVSHPALGFELESSPTKRWRTLGLIIALVFVVTLSYWGMSTHHSHQASSVGDELSPGSSQPLAPAETQLPVKTALPVSPKTSIEKTSHIKVESSTPKSADQQSIERPNQETQQQGLKALQDSSEGTRSTQTPPSPRADTNQSKKRSTTAKPKTTKRKTAKPKTTKRKTAKPKTAKPKTAKPKTVKPKTAKPNERRKSPRQTKRPSSEESARSKSPPQILSSPLSPSRKGKDNLKQTTLTQQVALPTPPNKETSKTKGKLKRRSDISNNVPKVKNKAAPLNSASGQSKEGDVPRPQSRPQKAPKPPRPPIGF